jgi:hypothetical protein
MLLLEMLLLAFLRARDGPEYLNQCRAACFFEKQVLLVGMI